MAEMEIELREEGGQRHHELKAVSADGCRSLSECQWKAARLGEQRWGIYAPSDKRMRPRTAVDNMRYYHRIHLEVASSPSPATATTFLPDRGGGGERLWGMCTRYSDAVEGVPGTCRCSPL